MDRVVLRSCEVMTRDGGSRFTAFRMGRKHFVSSTIYGDEIVDEVPGREAALVTLGLRVIAMRNLVKQE